MHPIAINIVKIAKKDVVVFPVSIARMNIARFNRAFIVIDFVAAGNVPVRIIPPVVSTATATAAANSVITDAQTMAIIRLHNEKKGEVLIHDLQKQ